MFKGNEDNQVCGWLWNYAVEFWGTTFHQCLLQSADFVHVWNATSMTEKNTDQIINMPDGIKSGCSWYTKKCCQLAEHLCI